MVVAGWAPIVATVLMCIAEHNLKRQLGEVFFADWDAQDAQELKGGIAAILAKVAAETVVVTGPLVFVIKPIVAILTVRFVGDRIVAQLEEQLRRYHAESSKG